MVKPNPKSSHPERGIARPMNFTRTTLLLLVLTVFGMGFSGYLTAGVLLAASCPLNGGCTRVFGLPSCLYGLTMYTIMLILILLIRGRKVAFVTGRRLVLLVSLIGMLFAGSLLVEEYLNRSPITICAIGFVMYVLILHVGPFMEERVAERILESFN